MSHGIDTVNGKATMAYAHDAKKPWHSLGNQLTPDADDETWLRESGLNFEVLGGELLFRDANGNLHNASKALNRRVLYRADSLAPLSVMSENRYNIHQPRDVFAFHAEVSRKMGWPMHTAGALFGGRKIWALAKLPEAITLARGDKVEGHLLSAGSFDGSTGSEFRFVSECVVCANTLQMALDEKAQGTTVYHSSSFDAAKIASQLGVYEKVWGGFIEIAKRLAAIKVTRTDAIQILKKVYPEKLVVKGVARKLSDDEFLSESEAAAGVLRLFEGDGMGADLTSRMSTGWGLVNAVTQRVDHHGSNRNAKLNSAWFGAGAAKKAAVVDAVLAL
jgi:phage/plasmid-like protein (TIGR03299 family)